MADQFLHGGVFASLLFEVIIAIDGPAASGKSTTAHMVSECLSLVHMDSGLMYRAIAYGFLKHNIECVSHCAKEFLPTMQFDVQSVNSVMKVYVDSMDVTSHLHTAEITEVSSTVAKIPSVRHWLLNIQREFSHEFGSNPGIVTVGRDMGTVVFPNAAFKFFLTASVEIRAQRRFKELRHKGIKTTYQEVHDAIVQRDYQDTHREIAPLKRAHDAIVINTNHLTPEGQMNIIISKVREQ